MQFAVKQLVVLADTVSREFPGIPGSRFDIRPASHPAFVAASQARLNREIYSGVRRASVKASVKAASWTPKNPPPALREKLGPEAKITRAQIREWQFDNELDQLKEPEAGPDNRDVLLLVVGGLVPTDEGDVPYSDAVGAQLLASDLRVPASVAVECGEDGAESSARLGDLWQSWVLRIAQDEANYTGESQSPKG